MKALAVLVECRGRGSTAGKKRAVLRKEGVILTKEQETALLEMATKGTAGARPIRRAHSLLLSWEGQTDAQNAAVLRCHE